MSEFEDRKGVDAGFVIGRVKINTEEILNKEIEKIDKALSILDILGVLLDEGKITRNEQRWLGWWTDVFCMVHKEPSGISEKRKKEIVNLARALQ